jgi:type IV secretory pathway VirB2 component (pilin)
MTSSVRRRLSASNLLGFILALGVLVILPDLAFAQGDPFTEGASWFQGSIARGVAMVAVMGLGVALWIFRASLGLVGMVLGGGVVVANAAIIVGWMGL